MDVVGKKSWRCTFIERRAKTRIYSLLKNTDASPISSSRQSEIRTFSLQTELLLRPIRVRGEHTI